MIQRTYINKIDEEKPSSVETYFRLLMEAMYSCDKRLQENLEEAA